MIELEYLHFKNRTEFRNWLKKNYATSPGIWMVFYKNHTNMGGIKYNEALEELLCFGWIDSTVKRIDHQKYVRKFTPRRDTKKWSDINKKKVMELIEKGIMTEAGLNKIDVYLKTGKVDWKVNTSESKKISKIPDFIIKALSENEPALKNFNTLAPSYQKQYIVWITSAKREETVLNRLRESITFLKENKKLGLK